MSSKIPAPNTARVLSPFATIHLATLVAFSALGPVGAIAEDLRSFEVNWSGADYGNSASATARITMDLDQVQNPGSTYGISWVSDFSITVTGAVAGNGTWSKDDIEDFRMLTGSIPLDFSSELVGQNGWATQSSSSRDFALAGSFNGAPVSTGYFVIRSDEGRGDRMKLSSFTPTETTAPTRLILQPDFDFANGRGVDAGVYALAEDSQGRLIAGGEFHRAGDGEYRGIARFRKGGEVDPLFQVGYGIGGGKILDLAVLPDDSIVAVGDFTSYNGSHRPFMVKILPNGMMDEGFASDPDHAIGANAPIHCIQRMPDGGFMIGGAFSSYGAVSRERIARLDANGALDPSFQTGGGFNSPSDHVNRIHLLDDGRILVAGRFTGYRAHGTENVMRILQDGDVDPDFHSTVAMDQVNAMAVLTTGEILVGGTSPGQTLFRLDENGTMDPDFNPDFTGDEVRDVMALPNGDILVSGQIQNNSGPYFSNLLILESNGLLNPDGFSERVELDSWAGPLLQGSEDNIYVGGAFTTVNPTRPYPYGRLARFVNSTSGLPNISFQSSTGTISEGGYRNFEVLVNGEPSTPADFQVTVEADDPSLLTKLNVQPFFTIYPGDTRQSFQASFQDDLAINGPRSFRLRITSLSAGMAVGSPDLMTVTVQDNDAPGTVFLESANGVMHEGRGAFAVKVRRYLDDPGALTVRLRTLDGTALAGRDYQGVDTLVDFPEGVYERTIDIGGPPSTPDENPLRRFTVELYDPSEGVFLGSPNMMAIDVNDKDDPGSGIVAYTVPDPTLLVRIVDLALDADNVLFGLAYYSLGAPSALESRILRFSANGEGQVIAAVPTNSQYSWANDIEFGSDGRLYVGGSGLVLRYLPDGSMDPAWTNPIAYDISLPTTIQCMLPMADGKLMIAGRIIDPINGQLRWQVARIMPDGSLDPTFDLGEILPVGSINWIYDMARDRSGGLLIAGNISSIQGTPRLNVVRTFADGSLDGSFDASAAISSQGLSQAVTRVSVAPDGKIYLAGTGVIRVNADGSLDTGFARANGNRFALQPDGKLIVTGPYLHAMRYDSSGQLDGGFSPYHMDYGGVHAIELGRDGRIHFAGQFFSFDGAPAPCVATLKGGPGAAAGRIGWDAGHRAVGERIGSPVATLSRLDSNIGNVGVHYTLVAETADVGTDVVELSGYHEFLPGETEHMIAFDVLDDGTQEQTESFRIVLHDPSGGVKVAGPGHFQIDIVDDDSDDIAGWIARHFPANPLDRSVMNEDSDGDAMTTFAEWMTDSDPTLGSDAKHPRSGWHVAGAAGAEQKHFGVSFYMNPSKPGSRAVVERSGLLTDGSWSAIWDSAADPLMESELIHEHPDAGAGWMTVRSPDAAGAREFLRVRYEGDP